MQIETPFRWLQPVLGSFVSTHGVQPVCAFTSAKPVTVQRWLSNANPAKGGNEIRLWHLMVAAGYEFPELEIPEYNHYLAQLYAYSIITIEEVMQSCGVRNSQTALQIMRGQPPMQPVMLLEDLRELYGSQLQQAMAALQQALAVETHILPDLPAASAEVEALAPALQVLVPALANQLAAVLPLTKLALESWTPEQRAHLRELVGDDVMFVLSNNLNALCSERARAKQQGR